MTRKLFGGVPTRRRLVVALLLAATLIAGCSTSDDAPGETASETEELTGGHVGTLDGTDAYVAVVSGDDEFVAYVCDGEADIAEWFAGTVEDDGRIELTNANGATIAATVGSNVVGTVELADGSSHAFVASAATGDAGVSRIDDDAATAAGVVGGWVVGLDGTVRGSLRVGGKQRTAAARPAPTVAVDDRSYRVVRYMVSSLPGPAGPVPVPYPNVPVTTTTAPPRDG